MAGPEVVHGSKEVAPVLARDEIDDLRDSFDPWILRSVLPVAESLLLPWEHRTGLSRLTVGERAQILFYALTLSASEVLPVEESSFDPELPPRQQWKARWPERIRAWAWRFNQRPFRDDPQLFGRMLPEELVRAHMAELCARLEDLEPEVLAGTYVLPDRAWREFVRWEWYFSRNSAARVPVEEKGRWAPREVDGPEPRYTEDGFFDPEWFHERYPTHAHIMVTNRPPPDLSPDDDWRRLEELYSNLHLDVDRTTWEEKVALIREYLRDFPGSRFALEFHSALHSFPLALDVRLDHLEHVARLAQGKFSYTYIRAMSSLAASRRLDREQHARFLRQILTWREHGTAEDVYPIRSYYEVVRLRQEPVLTADERANLMKWWRTVVMGPDERVQPRRGMLLALHRDDPQALAAIIEEFPDDPISEQARTIMQNRGMGHLAPPARPRAPVPEAIRKTTPEAVPEMAVLMPTPSRVRLGNLRGVWAGLGMAVFGIALGLWAWSQMRRAAP